MAYKLLRMTEQRWRRLAGFQPLPLVCAKVQFIDGEQVEWEDTQEPRRVAAYTVRSHITAPRLPK